MNSRRSFIKTGSAAAGALLLSAPAARGARSTITWRIATSWPTRFPVFEHGATRFAELVKNMTGGEFLIEIDSASKHKDAFGVFDMVREGMYEMGHSCSYYWKGKDPSLTTLAVTPFGMNAQEQNAWFWYGGGVDLMNKAYSRHGLYSFNAGNTAVQMGGWFRKEISTIEDLKGLKMRIPGLAGEVLARVGAKPTVIPGGELYTALERGVIDALEWVGPHLDITMGFQQIADYYYTGWHEPATELQYLINRSAFDALSPEMQAILKLAMKETSFDMLCESFYRNSVTWAEIKDKYPNVKIRQFPRQILEALHRETEAILDEMAGESEDLKEILDSQRQFLAKTRLWTAITDQQFLKMRGKGLGM